MTETTTIEITTSQKQQLDDLKRDDSESYKSVLQLLIDNYSTTGEQLDEAQVREISRDVVNDMVTYRALE